MRVEPLHYFLPLKKSVFSTLGWKLSIYLIIQYNPSHFELWSCFNATVNQMLFQIIVTFKMLQDGTFCVTFNSLHYFAIRDVVGYFVVMFQLPYFLIFITIILNINIPNSTANIQCKISPDPKPRIWFNGPSYNCGSSSSAAIHQWRYTYKNQLRTFSVIITNVVKCNVTLNHV